MPLLTDKEFQFIKLSFGRYPLHRSQFISEISFYMIKYHQFDARPIVESLVEKKVVSLSPDKLQIKFTDYGLELYHTMNRDQKEWEAKDIIQISHLDRDQILIQAGETFKANRVLREIIAQAKDELGIIDPYVGASLFDLIEDAGNRISIKVITSARVDPMAVAAYKAFKNQYGSTEMRTLAQGKLHDRYILWDKSAGLHLGHSIKDLGKKDAQLNLLKNPTDQWSLFEQRWLEATPVP